MANICKPARDTAIPMIAQREDVSWATMAPATRPPTISQIAMRFLLATAAGSVGRATKARYRRALRRGQLASGSNLRNCRTAGGR